MIFGANKQQSISKNGIDLIKNFEELRLESYPDQKGVPTVGWGSTGNVVLGMTITVGRAEELLKRDLQEAEKAVRSLIRIPLNQNQYDALVSFTFNVGSASLQVSTLRRILNAKNYQGVPAQMARWNKVKIDGVYQVSNGLVRRRKLEGELFIK